MTYNFADRRTFLASVASAGAVSLAGCVYFQSDDALDISVKNDTSLGHEVRMIAGGSTGTFRESTTISSGDEVTFEDVIPYPERPEAVEYSIQVNYQALHEDGAFALSDELARFGFQIVESDAGDKSMTILTVYEYRD